MVDVEKKEEAEKQNVEKQNVEKRLVKRKGVKDAEQSADKLYNSKNV